MGENVGVAKSPGVSCLHHSKFGTGGAWLGKGLSLPSGRQRVNLQSSLAVLPLDRACWDFLPAVLHHEDLCAGEIPGHSCN